MTVPLIHNARVREASLLAYIYQKNTNIVVHCPTTRLISYDAYINYFYDLSDEQLAEAIKALKEQKPANDSVLHEARWRALLKSGLVFPKPIEGKYTNTDDQTAAIIVRLYDDFLRSEGMVLLPDFLKQIPFDNPDETYKNSIEQAQFLFRWLFLNRDIVEHWQRVNGKSNLELLGNILGQEIKAYFEWVLKEDGEPREGVTKSARIEEFSSRFLDKGNLKDVLFPYSFIEQLTTFESYFDNDESSGINPTHRGIQEIAKVAYEQLLPVIQPKLDEIEGLDPQSKDARTLDVIIAMFMPSFEYAEKLRGYVPLSQVFGAFLYNNLMTNYIKPYVFKEIKEGNKIEDILLGLSNDASPCKYDSEHGGTAEDANQKIAMVALREACNFDEEYTDNKIAGDMEYLRQHAFSCLPPMLDRDRVLDLREQCLTDDDIPALQELLKESQYQKVHLIDLSNNYFSQAVFNELVNWIKTRQNNGILHVLCEKNQPLLEKERINRDELGHKAFVWTPELLAPLVNDGTVLDLSAQDLCDGDLEELVKFLRTSRFCRRYPNISEIKLNGNFLSVKAIEILMGLSDVPWKIKRLPLDQNALISCDSPTVAEKVKQLAGSFPLLDNVPVQALKHAKVVLRYQELSDIIEPTIKALKPWFGGRFGNWNKTKLQNLTEQAALEKPYNQAKYRTDVVKILKDSSQFKALFVFLCHEKTNNPSSTDRKHKYAKAAAVLASTFDSYLINKGIIAAKDKKNNYTEYLDYYKDPNNLQQAIGLVDLYETSEKKFKSWYTSFRRLFSGYSYTIKLAELRSSNNGQDLAEILHLLKLKDEESWINRLWRKKTTEGYTGVAPGEGFEEEGERDVFPERQQRVNDDSFAPSKSYRSSIVSQFLRAKNEGDTSYNDRSSCISPSRHKSSAIYNSQASNDTGILSALTSAIAAGKSFSQDPMRKTSSFSLDGSKSRAPHKDKGRSIGLPLSSPNTSDDEEAPTSSARSKSNSFREVQKGLTETPLSRDNANGSTDTLVGTAEFPVVPSLLDVESSERDGEKDASNIHGLGRSKSILMPFPPAANSDKISEGSQITNKIK